MLGWGEGVAFAGIGGCDAVGEVGVGRAGSAGGVAEVTAGFGRGRFRACKTWLTGWYGPTTDGEFCERVGWRRTMLV